MRGYAAFLRAVNVGGAGRLPSLLLRSMVTNCGGQDARAIGASGNALFLSDGPGAAVGACLGAALANRFGRAMPVFVRTAEQLDTVLGAMPFDEPDPARVAVVFLDTPLPDDPATEARGLGPETLVAGHGCLFIHYPVGQGRSRLRHPALESGTARNLNTVAKALEVLRTMEGAE